MSSVILIALRNLFGEKGRLAITVGGVTFSVILILMLTGLYNGWNTQMTKFLSKIDTDLWVAQKGIRDLSHSPSILSNNLVVQLKKEKGVESVTPFVIRTIKLKFNDKEEMVSLVGVEENGPVKPYQLVTGSSFPKKGEIILDETVTQKYGLKLGDLIKVDKTNLKLTGIASGGYLLIYSFALINMSDIREIFELNDFSNYFLVKSQDPKLTKENLQNDFSKVSVFEKQEFLDANAAVIKDAFLPIIGVLLVISLLIGIAVIGLTIFTTTIEKSREFGVLKALGFSNFQLFSISLIQALTAGVIGLIISNLLSPVLAYGVSKFVDGFIYETTLINLLEIAVTVIVMSVLASLIPLQRIVSIDPADVFKA